MNGGDRDGSGPGAERIEGARGAGPGADEADRLRQLRVVLAFADLDEDQLAFLAELATFTTLQPGETLFREGDPADVMFAVLEGEIRSKREQGPPDGRLFIRRSGQIGGMLPFARLTHFPVTARAVPVTRLACFAASAFPRLLERVPILESRLAQVMADRVREAAQFDQQRDKLTSIGKLAAGLAHEINNPAVAIQRSSEELARRVEALASAARLVLAELAPAARLERVPSRDGSPGAAAVAALDPLERSDAEDALASWLAAQGVPEPWTRAETLLAAGVTVEELEAATHELPGTVRAAAVQVIEAELAATSLLAEIGDAAKRIADLVSAVKSFSHLDRAPTKQPVDIRDGLRSTLAMLGHKLRGKGVTLQQDHPPELPRVHANAGELNQVWANLIDNAADAVAEGGVITVRSRALGREVLIEVIDDGPGIPSEIRWRVFEPFFTTKEVGQGSGIGLDVVQRIVTAHRGDVRFESEPGRTCFEVRLPVVSDDDAAQG